MEKKKKDPEYKEEKAVRVKLGDDKEYVAVILDGELSIALGVGAGVAGVKGEFERKKGEKTVLAQYMKDPEYGLIPHHLWVERKKLEVAGTLSPHVEVPIYPEHVNISGISGTNCMKCGRSNVIGSKFCNDCGTALT